MSINRLISDPAASGAFWLVPLAGFANPRYVGPAGQSLADQALGFWIGDCKAVSIAFDSNGAVPTAILEQTHDSTGLTGWFSVGAKRADGSANTLSSAIGTLAIGWVAPAVGVRCRIRVTALTTADLRARIYKSSDNIVVTGGITPVNSASALSVAGAAAQDAVISGNPIPAGGDGRDAQKTQMSAEGDVVYNWLTRNGRQVVVPHAPPALTWVYAGVAGGIVSSTADVVLKAAAGAGIRNVIEQLAIGHNALGAATEYVIKDGATVIFRGMLQTPAAETEIITFPRPLRSTANAALNFALITSVTGGVVVNAAGHTTND